MISKKTTLGGPTLEFFKPLFSGEKNSENTVTLRRV